MQLLNTIIVGLKEIWAHKMRSLLTMLGIILGVASLVAMAALTKGMENGMKETMIAMGGADKVLVEEADVPPEQEHLANEAPGRTMQDVVALKAAAPLVRLVSPEMAIRSVVLTHADKSVVPAELVGTWPAALEMNLHTVQYGRFFNEIDDEMANNVIVIGTGIRDELFGSPEKTGRETVPLGETINLNGQPFIIIGMFQEYMSEQTRKERELARHKGPEKEEGPKRKKGWGPKGGGWAFMRKNMTAYIPLNTIWIRFKAAGDAVTGIPDPRLS